MEDNQKYQKGVLQDEFVKNGFYDKPRVQTSIDLDKGAYDKVKDLAGFKRGDKVSAKTVIESALRQMAGSAPNKNFIILKN